MGLLPTQVNSSSYSAQDSSLEEAMENAIAANVLGTTGAVCWSVQLIPQIVVNYRRHHTTGLQPTMMLLWATAGIPLGVYNITQSFNVALQVQPQILTLLSLLTWAQCKYYCDGNTVDERRWSIKKCTVVICLLGALMGGIEVALVFALREAVKRDLAWPGMLMAVLAAVLLCAGVARHYWDIYKERTVRGISFLFVGLDALGDLTSLVSVLFQAGHLDILGLVIYGSELLLWLGVFACGGWYNFRPWMRGLNSKRSSDTLEMEIPSDRDETKDHAEPDRASVETTRSSASVTSSVFRTASTASIGVDERRREDAADLRLRNVHLV